MFVKVSDHKILKFKAKLKEKQIFATKKKKLVHGYKASDVIWLKWFQTARIDFLCDEQIFIEVKQQPQAGPETHTMWEKSGNFWKNQIL